jgi:hypothetical protein
VAVLAAPQSVTGTGPGRIFVTFAETEFGTVQLQFPPLAQAVRVRLCLGERKGEGDTLWNPRDWEPAAIGAIGYLERIVDLAKGQSYFLLDVGARFRPRPEDLPLGLQGVLPFRYLTLEGLDVAPQALEIRQVSVRYPSDPNAARFHSSDATLDEVWNLCKHTVEATTYAGLFVDGNRERKPYEADAYINQLGHYSLGRDYALARYSQNYLLANPTAFTEWTLHSVLMAHADYMQTGDLSFIRENYELLRAKSLVDLGGEDGLISTQGLKADAPLLRGIGIRGAALTDLVDWPASERDHYQVAAIPRAAYWRRTFEYALREGRARVAAALGFKYAAWAYRERAQALAESRYAMPSTNTVVNEFHYAALGKMAELASALGRRSDEAMFLERAARVRHVLQAKFTVAGLFVDGVGSSHASLHANMFALAFDLVPSAHRQTVLAYVQSKGMACSVYGAQYLLEGLIKAGAADQALALLSAHSDRSWWNMAHALGSTLTLEAWNPGIKPNQDWNHAWGSAPVNIISRWLMGIRPLEPGCGTILVQPRPGSLAAAEITVPFPMGVVRLAFRNRPGLHVYDLIIPNGSRAVVQLPQPPGSGCQLRVNGRRQQAVREGDFLSLGELGPGQYHFSLTTPLPLAGPGASLK